MKLPIDLLLFDFDGTLTNSLPTAVKAIQLMLKELNLPDKTIEEINPHIGFGETALVSGSIGSRDPALVEKAKESYFRHARELAEEISLYPHIRDVLEFFKDKKMIIVSNKRDMLIRHILRLQNLAHYFSSVLGGDSASCLKPDPCAILEKLGKYQVEKSKAILVGDMTIDVETGKNAGIHTCAVTYGFDDKAKLAAAKPDFLIDDLLELKNLII
ncbi:MAG: HAD-IA family hydrolase [Candidatus Margulisiibacteriota bacterium]